MVEQFYKMFVKSPHEFRIVTLNGLSIVSIHKMTDIFSFLENAYVSFSINPVLRPSMAHLPTFCDVHAILLSCFVFFVVQRVCFDQVCSTHLYVNILWFLSPVQDVNINTVPLLCFHWCLSLPSSLLGCLLLALKMSAFILFVIYSIYCFALQCWGWKFHVSVKY